MTTLAVLSDVHGNSLALKAVLADLDAQGGADQYLNLGDLAVFGPDPKEVFDLIVTRTPMLHICGNTDRYLVEKQYPGTPGGTDWESQVLASFPWTADQLGLEELEFLAAMPARQMVHLSPTHTILAVHGSPRSDEENMRPDTPDGVLAKMMPASPPYNLLLCAHTHLPFDRIVDGKRVVNVGSVGLPFDGIPKAGYALIRPEAGGTYSIDLRRVDYDIDAVVQHLNKVNHPTAHVSEHNLRTARPLGSELVYTDKMRRGKENPSLESRGFRPTIVNP